MATKQTEVGVSEFVDDDVKKILPEIAELSSKLDISDDARYFSIFFTTKPIFPNNTQLCIYHCTEKDLQEVFEDFHVSNPNREVILRQVALEIYERYGIPVATKCDVQARAVFVFTSTPLPQSSIVLEDGKTLDLQRPKVTTANGGVLPTDLGFESEDMEIKRSMARMMLNNEMGFINIGGVKLTRLLNRDMYPRIEQVVEVSQQGLQVARLLVALKVGNTLTGRNMNDPRGPAWLLSKYKDKELITQYRPIMIPVGSGFIPLVKPFPIIDWVTHVLESGRVVAMADLSVRFNTPPSVSLKTLAPAIIDKTRSRSLFTDCHFYVADYSKKGVRFSRLGFTFDLVGDIDAASPHKREDAKRFLKEYGLSSEGNRRIIEQATEFVRIRRNRVSYRHRATDNEFFVPLEFLVPSVDFNNAGQFEETLGLPLGYIGSRLSAMVRKHTTLYALEYHAILTLIRETLSKSKLKVNMVRLGKEPNDIPLVIGDELKALNGDAADPIKLFTRTFESEIDGPLKNRYEASEYEIDEGDFIEFRAGPLQPIYALIGAVKDGQEGFAVIPTQVIAHAFVGKRANVRDTRQKSGRGREYKEIEVYRPLRSAFRNRNKVTIGIVGTEEPTGVAGIPHAEICNAVWLALNGNHTPLAEIMSKTKIGDGALKNWRNYLTYMANAFGITSKLDVRYYPLNPMKLNEPFKEDFVLDFGTLIPDHKVQGVSGEYARAIKRAFNDDGCDALVVFQPRGRKSGKDALYSYLKACALDLRKPIKIYDQPIGKGAWTLQKQLFRVIVQMLMELNEGLGGRNFEPITYDYSDPSHPAFIPNEGIDDWRKSLAASNSLIPDFFRFYLGNNKIWALAIQQTKVWNRSDGGKQIAMVMTRPIGGTGGKIILNSLVGDPDEKLEPWIGQKIASLIKNATTPPGLVILLTDNRSIDSETMRRIADRIHEAGADVLSLGFSSSGVPHGWSFQVLGGRLKVKPPSEYMIGVGNSVYVFSHYKPLVQGVWKATCVQYHPETSRGEVRKHLEQPPNGNDWPPSKSVIHNLANLFHLMARDASYSPTPRENKYPMLLTKSSDLGRLLKDKKLPFASWVGRQERSSDLSLL